MKLSQGFSKLIPSVLIFVFYALSFFLFTMSLKRIDVSIAYVIWAGLGMALIAVIGIFGFKEPVNALKMVSLLVIVAGVIGLNLRACLKIKLGSNIGIGLMHLNLKRVALTP